VTLVSTGTGQWWGFEKAAPVFAGGQPEGTLDYPCAGLLEM